MLDDFEITVYQLENVADSLKLCDNPRLKELGYNKKFQKRWKLIMTNSTTGKAVPEAKAALDKFKYEVASELGVPLKEGYNGDLTSKQNGSVGGYMVKAILPERNICFTRDSFSADRKEYEMKYSYQLAM